MVTKRKDAYEDVSDEGRFHTPKSRGGRTGKTLNGNRNPNFMQNLKPWRKGQSGNTSGLSKSAHDIQRMARDMTPDVLKTFYAILNDPSMPPNVRVQAGMYIGDRGNGKPYTMVAVADATDSLLPLSEDGEPISALLLRAERERMSDERIISELRAALRRHEEKFAKDREAYEARLAGDAAALANGEEIPGISRMLLDARAAKNAKEGH